VSDQVDILVMRIIGPYLVAISPEVVLGAEVLVGVLGPLRARVLVLLVGNMLPVSIPPDLCVDAGNDDARDGDAAHSVSKHSSFSEQVQCNDAISDRSMTVPRAPQHPQVILFFFPPSGQVGGHLLD